MILVVEKLAGQKRKIKEKDIDKSQKRLKIQRYYATVQENTKGAVPMTVPIFMMMAQS
jgi:hypothetical protein